MKKSRSETGSSPDDSKIFELSIEGLRANLLPKMRGEQRTSVENALKALTELTREHRFDDLPPKAKESIAAWAIEGALALEDRKSHSS